MTVLPPADDDRAGCAARQERVAELEDLAEELREAAGAQSDQIAALREQVAKLELVLSRNSGNSGNSAIQPSGDDTPGRGKPAKKPRPAGKRNRASGPARRRRRWAGTSRTRPSTITGPGSAHAAGTLM